jgi:hypothetical protein
VLPVGVRREDSTRPHTSLGFAEDMADASSQRPSPEADPERRLQLGAHDREAALKYFIRFGTTTRLGEKLMPFYRFDRMVHSVGLPCALLRCAQGHGAVSALVIDLRMCVAGPMDEVPISLMPLV